MVAEGDINLAKVCTALVDELGEAVSCGALERPCATLARALGYAHHHATLVVPWAGALSFGDIPEPFGARYLSEAVATEDPLRRTALARRGPFTLADAERAIPFGEGGERARRVVAELRGAGLRDALGIPLHGPGGESGLLVLFAVRRRERPSARALAAARLVALALHEAAARVLERDAGASENAPERLTVREREVLGWVAEGKTTWEIARILSLSERTVLFHLRNCAAKLDAVNRTQTVVIALMRSLIAMPSRARAYERPRSAVVPLRRTAGLGR